MVREATERDLPALGRLRTAMSAEYSKLIPHIFMEVADHAPTLEEGSLWCVAEVEGEVVGFAFGLIQPSAPHPVLRPRTLFMLHEIGVAAVHRSEGVGSAILDCCAAWAETRGVKEIELNVYAASPPAVAFYRRHGFEVRAMRMARTTAMARTPEAP